jgi:hypothetical protein
VWGISDIASKILVKVGLFEAAEDYGKVFR